MTATIEKPLLEANQAIDMEILAGAISKVPPEQMQITLASVNAYIDGFNAGARSVRAEPKNTRACKQKEKGDT